MERTIFPADVVGVIVNFLSQKPSTAVDVSLVNSQWRQGVVSNEDLWLRLSRRIWQTTSVKCGTFACLRIRYIVATKLSEKKAQALGCRLLVSTSEREDAWRTQFNPIENIQFSFPESQDQPNCQGHVFSSTLTLVSPAATADARKTSSDELERFRCAQCGLVAARGVTARATARLEAYGDPFFVDAVDNSVKKIQGGFAKFAAAKKQRMSAIYSSLA